MTATEARKNADDYVAGLHKDHEKWLKKHNKEQAALLQKSLKEHWPRIKAKIDAIIERLSKEGKRQTDASYGSGEVFYFDTYHYTGPKEIRILWEYAIQHYKGLGFKVTEYAGCGLQLSW